MKELEKEIAKLNNSLRGIGNSISIMEQNPLIQEYLELRRKEEELLARKKRLEDARNEKLQETCSHIFVKPLGTKDNICLKCGLGPRKASSAPQLYTNIECDFITARRVFQKIVADHPNIADVDAAYMLKDILKRLNDSEEEKHR